MEAVDGKELRRLNDKEFREEVEHGFRVGFDATTFELVDLVAESTETNSSGYEEETWVLRKKATTDLYKVVVEIVNFTPKLDLMKARISGDSSDVRTVTYRRVIGWSRVHARTVVRTVYGATPGVLVSSNTMRDIEALIQREVNPKSTPDVNTPQFVTTEIGGL